MKVLWTLAVSLAVLLVALGAGCGGNGGGGETTTSKANAPTSQAETTSVKMDEYAFDPSNVVVKHGAKLQVNNDGAIAHNLTVEQGPNPKTKTKKLAGTPTFTPGKSESLDVSLKPGKYAMVCTVPGHRELGMTGTFTVK